MFWRNRSLLPTCFVLTLFAASPLQAEPATESGPRADRGAVTVATGLVSLPERHTYRVMLVKVGKDEVPIRFAAKVLDQRGEVVARSTETLRGGRAAVLDVQRLDVERVESVQVRTHLLLRPLRPAGPRGDCPVIITLQTLEGDLEDGPFETCGVNPCCPECGPGGFEGVQFMCNSATLITP